MRKVFCIFSIIAIVSLIGGPARAEEPDWAEKAGGTEFDRDFGIAVDKLAKSCGTGYELDWAKRAGGIGDNSVMGIGVDKWRNSYVTGHFSHTMTFGAGGANETELTSAGGDVNRFEINMFVAKYDRKGGLVWARMAGGIAGNYVGSIDVSVDEWGNSYVTGGVIGTVTFGAGEANETDLTSVGGNFNMFVAKYDRKGRLVWARQASRRDNHAGGGPGVGISVDGWGNSYVTGFFGKTMIFGAGEANETELTSAGVNSSMFVAKYDRKGRLVWARQAVVNGYDYVNIEDIAADCWGNSYVTGSFWGTVTFGAGEANETDLTNAGGVEDTVMFVAKYDHNGHLVWAKQAVGIVDHANDNYSIAVDRWGNSYTTGRFDGSVTFGAGEANETELTSAGISDAFVAKYDRKGRLVWTKQISGIGNNIGRDIAVDKWGNSYVTGEFANAAVTFGAGEANETELTNAGESDIFVAKYDNEGRLVWAKQGGGMGYDWGVCIAVDQRGSSYAAGRFNGTVIFGAGEANETELTSSDEYNIFVVKYKPLCRKNF